MSILTGPLTIPTCPTFPAGYVAQLEDMQNLAACCTFLLQKPITKVRDTVGGQSLPDFFDSTIIVTFSVADYDVDGMWNSDNPTQLTVQTPGWYKVRYGLNTLNLGIGFVRYITGANNPLGSGLTSQNIYGCYASQTSAFLVGGGSGIFPYYLYSGDGVQLYAASNGDSADTSVQNFASSTNAGSYLSLEYVSTT
jgi:hypothetical protein